MATKPRPLPFARLVKRWRSVRKLTKADAARQLGIPYRTFQSWELGDRTPRGIAKWLILDKLGALKRTRSKLGLSKKQLDALLQLKYDSGADCKMK